MKKAISLSIVLLTCFSLSIAQISEEERAMTQGIKNSLTIRIPNADDRMVEKLWKKFMKSNKAKPKKIKRSDEWFSDDADIPSIGGSNDVDIYTIFEEKGDDLMMTAWFDLGGIYLNSSDHPEKYKGGEELLIAFELEVYQEKVRGEIKDEEKNMEKIEGALKKLKKNNDRLHKEIKAAEKKIAKAEKDIESNLKEQEETNTKIEAQKEVVENTKKKLDVREKN